MRVVDRLRSLIAAYLDGDAGGIAAIPAVSYGIATAAANVDIPPGSTIVVLAEQFPSNVYEWRAAAARVGAEVLTVHAGPDGWTPRVLEAIDGRTAVVAIEPAHWTRSAKWPVATTTRSRTPRRCSTHPQTCRRVGCAHRLQP